MTELHVMLSRPQQCHRGLALIASVLCCTSRTRTCLQRSHRSITATVSLFRGHIAWSLHRTDNNAATAFTRPVNHASMTRSAPAFNVPAPTSSDRIHHTAVRLPFIQAFGHRRSTAQLRGGGMEVGAWFGVLVRRCYNDASADWNGDVARLKVPLRPSSAAMPSNSVAARWRLNDKIDGACWSETIDRVVCVIV